MTGKDYLESIKKNIKISIERDKSKYVFLLAVIVKNKEDMHEVKCLLKRNLLYGDKIDNCFVCEEDRNFMYAVAIDFTDKKDFDSVIRNMDKSIGNAIEQVSNMCLLLGECYYIYKEDDTNAPGVKCGFSFCAYDSQYEYYNMFQWEDVCDELEQNGIWLDSINSEDFLNRNHRIFEIPKIRNMFDFNENITDIKEFAEKYDFLFDLSSFLDDNLLIINNESSFHTSESIEGKIVSIIDFTTEARRKIAENVKHLKATPKTSVTNQTDIIIIPVYGYSKNEYKMKYLDIIKNNVVILKKDEFYDKYRV